MNWLQKISQYSPHKHQPGPPVDPMSLVSQTLSMVPSYFPQDLADEIGYRLQAWVESIQDGSATIQHSDTPFALLYLTVNDILDNEAFRANGLL